MDKRATVAVVKEFMHVPEFETGRLLLGSLVASAAMAATTAVTGLGFIAWRATGILLAALLVLMSVALFTDFYTHEDKRHYPWNKAIARKVLVVTVIVVSLVLDLVVYQAAQYFPQDFMLMDSGYLFLTMTTLIWLIAAELTCIIHVIEDAGEEDSIPPTLHLLARHLKWVLRSMKFVDRSRSGGEEDKDIEYPKRWYDDISDEQIEQLAKFLQGQQVEPPPSAQPATPTPPEERPLYPLNKDPKEEQ